MFGEAMGFASLNPSYELSARRPLSREHFRPGLGELHIGAALVHL